MIHRRSALVSALLVFFGLCAVPNPGRCEEAPAPRPAPTMNEELMARIIKYTRSVKVTGALDVRLAVALGVWSGSEDMPLKLAKSDETRDGLHYFGLPLDTGSRDVLLMVKTDSVVEAYLTDRTATLRAAAVLEKGTARLVPKEETTARFQAELALFAKEAAEQLPPTQPPKMTEELMARLVTRARASKLPAVMHKSVSKIFGLNDGTAEVPVRQVSEKVEDGKHMVIVPEKEGSTDVVLAYRRSEVTLTEYYLTDKTGVLRAAAVWDKDGIRLITNEQAAEKYQAELSLFAKLAEDLPPTTPPSTGK